MTTQAEEKKYTDMERLFKLFRGVKPINRPYAFFLLARNASLGRDTGIPKYKSKKWYETRAYIKDKFIKKDQPANEG